VKTAVGLEDHEGEPVGVRLTLSSYPPVSEVESPNRRPKVKIGAIPPRPKRTLPSSGLVGAIGWPMGVLSDGFSLSPLVLSSGAMS